MSTYTIHIPVNSFKTILKLLDSLIKQSIQLQSRLSSRSALINNFYARHVPLRLYLCVCMCDVFIYAAREMINFCSLHIYQNAKQTVGLGRPRAVRRE